MKLKDLWKLKDFRDTALKYYQEFKTDRIKADDTYDSWGGFQYKNWWYDLNLHIDEADNKTYDCLYNVIINCNGDLETGEDQFVISKPNGELI